MKTLENVAVLGGGAGARAVAADLSLQGCRVRMWDLPRFFPSLRPLQKDRAFNVTGVVADRATLDLVTDDLALACADAQAIFVVTQALAHAEIARGLAPVVCENQVIAVNPGSTGGALEFAYILRESGAVVPTIGETSTLTHACRLTQDAGVVIRMRVGLVKIAALLPSATSAVRGLLKPFFAGLEAAHNVLETMLSNGNPVIHPAIMLLNAGTVERSQGTWEFYEEGVTPAVAAVIEAVDRERLALGRALGLELLPEPEMSRRQGYSEHSDYLRAYRDGPEFQGLGGPDTMQHRYLTEDVSCALVTFLELAEVCGVAMPVTGSIVQLASAVLGRDLPAEARRGLQALGLGGMNREQILSYVQEGRRGRCG